MYNIRLSYNLDVNPKMHQFDKKIFFKIKAHHIFVLIFLDFIRFKLEIRTLIFFKKVYVLRSWRSLNVYYHNQTQIDSAIKLKKFILFKHNICNRTKILIEFINSPHISRILEISFHFLKNVLLFQLHFENEILFLRSSNSKINYWSKLFLF